MPEKYKKQILDVLFEYLDKNDCVVFIFGSNATGEAVGSSDIDIGILCAHQIRASVFLDLQEKLNEGVSTLKEIDLVDFSTVSDVVKKEALKEVKIWHTGKNCRGLLKNLMPR